VPSALIDASATEIETTIAPTQVTACTPLLATTRPPRTALPAIPRLNALMFRS
jgi:hypothetical protein